MGSVRLLYTDQPWDELSLIITTTTELDNALLRDHPIDVTHLILRLQEKSVGTWRSALRPYCSHSGQTVCGIVFTCKFYDSQSRTAKSARSGAGVDVPAFSFISG